MSSNQRQFSGAAQSQDVRLAPASQFTIEELTQAYNQTRVDYMVPMPMNAARLAAYIRVYDLDMERSWVALDDKGMLGLAMLGVRSGRSWVTRLGVLPARRRHGAGEALVRALLAETAELGRPLCILEVIKGNTAAHSLFKKVGFQETRELLVLRRPPAPPLDAPTGQVEWFEKEEALDRLCNPPGRLPWTNEIESYLNAGDAQGLQVSLADGSRGWLVFRRQKFYLTHFILRTEAGAPERVGAALVSRLYERFPNIDTDLENIPADDPHLETLLAQGFMEVFRRVEMHRATFPENN